MMNVPNKLTEGSRLSEEEVNEMKHEIISDSDYEQCDAQWDVPINSLRFNVSLLHASLTLF
jgi:hypothetical protein